MAIKQTNARRLTLPGGTAIKPPKRFGDAKVIDAPLPADASGVSDYLNEYQNRLGKTKTETGFTPFVDAKDGQVPQKGSGSDRSLIPVGPKPEDNKPAIPGANIITPSKDVINQRSLIPVGPAPESDRQGIPSKPGGADRELPVGDARAHIDDTGEGYYDPNTGELRVPGPGDAPEAPDLTDLFGELRDEYGIDGLENEMNLLKEEQRLAEARLRERTHTAEGKAVSMGVIGGRVSEIERQEMDRLDFIGRQLARKGDQLNSAYKAVDMFMGFENQDFQNALALYQTEFDNNMAAYKALRAEEEFDKTFEQRLIERDQDMARANLQIYMDQIAAGTLDYASMSSEMKAEIGKLEVKSGLGVGFVSKLKIPAGANIKSITTREDPDGYTYADTIYVNPDGSIKIVSTKIAKTKVAPRSGGSGGPSAQDKADAKTTAAFNKALASPGINIASSRSQSNRWDDEGESWIKREDLIRRLKVQFPSIDPGDISTAVYQYYRD